MFVVGSAISLARNVEMSLIAFHVSRLCQYGRYAGMTTNEEVGGIIFTPSSAAFHSPRLGSLRLYLLPKRLVSNLMIAAARSSKAVT